jgi:transposase
VAVPRHRAASRAAQDNGIGIDKPYLDKVFIPLQRLHGRKTLVFLATGAISAAAADDQEKIEAQLAEWDARLDLIKAKAKGLQAEAQIEVSSKHCNTSDTKPLPGLRTCASAASSPGGPSNPAEPEPYRVE